MLGAFGSSMFGARFSRVPAPTPTPSGGKIAVLGDTSSHGGTIISTNQDGTFKVAGVVVAVNGAQHSCPITGHGITPIVAVTIKSYHNGKLIITEGARAGCGAIIQPPDRKVEVE